MFPNRFPAIFSGFRSTFLAIPARLSTQPAFPSRTQPLTVLSLRRSLSNGVSARRRAAHSNRRPRARRTVPSPSPAAAPPSRCAAGNAGGRALNTVRFIFLNLFSRHFFFFEDGGPRVRCRARGAAGERGVVERRRRCQSVGERTARRLRPRSAGFARNLIEIA